MIKTPVHPGFSRFLKQQSAVAIMNIEWPICLYHSLWYFFKNSYPLIYCKFYFNLALKDQNSRFSNQLFKTPHPALRRRGDVAATSLCTSQMKHPRTSRWNVAKTSHWCVSTTSYWNVITTSQKDVTATPHHYVSTKSQTSLKWNTQRRLSGTLPRRLSGTYLRRPISTSLRRLL